MPEGSVDLVVTDCPYKIVSGGCTNARGGIFDNRDKTNTAVMAGKMFKENSITFSDWLPLVYKVLKQGTHCYIMINGRNLAELQKQAEQAGFQFVNLLVWKKNNLTMNRYYMNQCEFILMLRKGKARTINNPGTSNVLEIPNIIGRKAHPSEKPKELMKILIENSSDAGDVVLDPFMGAGSTGLAAAETGREFIGIELDKTYFEIAKERLGVDSQPWE